MKTKHLLVISFLFCGSLFAEENTVLWDFGLKTGIKWYNGSSTSIKNPTLEEMPLDIYPHFHYPSLSMMFTFYPKGLNMGFETSLEYYQFSGIIQSRNQGVFDMTDYQRDIFSFKENVKYLFVFGTSSIEYVFQPFAGLGIGFIPSRGEFNVSAPILDEATGISSLGTAFERGVRPIHSTSYDVHRFIFTGSLGIDIELRMDNFSIGARAGYDIGLNNFYTQKINYLYTGLSQESTTLKYYNSGINIGLSIKYLFRSR